MQYEFAGWIERLPVLSNIEISSVVVFAVSKCCVFSFALNFALSLAALLEKMKVLCISQEFNLCMLPDRKWFLGGKFPQGIQNKNTTPPKKERKSKNGKIR